MSEEYIVSFVIGVSNDLPPRVDEYRKVVLISSGNEVEDWQTACLIASRGVVLPVRSEIEYVEY